MKGMLIRVGMVAAAIVVIVSAAIIPSNEIIISAKGRISIGWGRPTVEARMKLADQTFTATEQTSNVVTNSPAGNSGASWTNPTRAYDDGGTGAATITSGAPSGSNSWGTYGISLPSAATVTQVRIRYDAWSSGYSSGATSQTSSPTSDVQDTASSTKSTGTTFYGVVDETSYSDTDYYTMVNNGGGHVVMNGPAFTVPAGATIANVTVYYRATNSGAANIRASILTGTTYRDTTDGGNDPSSFTTYSYAFTTNPATGAAWTYDEVNATDATTAHRLNGYGTASSDCNPDNQVSWVYCVVNYTPASEYNDVIKVDVSWDGGTSWSSTQDTTLTAAEVTTWYDVTAATGWTGTKLNDSNLKVRALATTVGGAEVVNLDWLPVEVTYTVGAGWLSGYIYRKEWTVTGTTAGAQTDYQMMLNIVKGSGTDATNTVYLGNAALDWPEDIRFTQADGSTQLDYWREESDATDGTWWIECNSIPASPSTTNFYVYYGKASDSDEISCPNTFIFGDDFDRADSATVGNSWSETNSSIASNTLDAKRTGGVDEVASHTSTVSGSVMYETRVKITNTAGNGAIIVFGAAANQAAGFLFGSLGYIYYGDSAGWNSTGVSATADTYYRWSMAFDSSDSKYDFWLDNVIKATDKTPISTSTTNQINYETNTNNLDMYSDWVLVRKYATPQPSVASWSSLEQVAVTVSPTSYNFGVVADSTTPYTTTSYFVIDNTSDMQTDQVISVTTSTWSGGVTWTHSDTATAGANTAGLKANRGGSWGTGDVIVKYASPNYIYENCPAATDYSFGLKLVAPSSVTDGVQKTITVRITATAG